MYMQAIQIIYLTNHIDVNQVKDSVLGFCFYLLFQKYIVLERHFTEFELRGPLQDQIKYFLPKGWKGYALKVQGKYDEGNDDWLKMNGNPNQWHIMYHGTNDFWVTLFLGEVFRQLGQPYENDKDIRTGEIVGEGVYFSNHVEVVENHSDARLRFGHLKYKILFQSRVRPQSLKQIEDIRPYRILLKNEIQQTIQIFYPQQLLKFLINFYYIKFNYLFENPQDKNSKMKIIKQYITNPNQLFLQLFQIGLDLWGQYSIAIFIVCKINHFILYNYRKIKFQIETNFIRIQMRSEQRMLVNKHYIFQK
ncbi:hypothetical protein pb186bvf_003164 [Paramecium bursaria]